MAHFMVPATSVHRGSLIYFGADHEDQLERATVVARVEERAGGEIWALLQGDWHLLSPSVFIEKPESVGFTMTKIKGVMECDQCGSLVVVASRDHHSAWHWFDLQD